MEKRVEGNSEGSKKEAYQRRCQGTNNPPVSSENENDFNARPKSSNNSSLENETSSVKRNREKPRERTTCLNVFESLLEKDSTELVLQLSKSKKVILELVDRSLTEDTIVLFVKILRNVADSSSEEIKYKVLQIYFDDLFREQLIKYILRLPISNKRQKNNQYFWKNPDEFWNNLIIICREIYSSLPTFGRKALPKVLKSLTSCFLSFESLHSCQIPDQIKENVSNLNEEVQNIVQEYEAKIEKALNKENEQPPDDFRRIPVYPNADELTAATPGFLRKNVIKGPYRNVNHYLDVQFRLLREDFVGPLRTAIDIYRAGSKHRLENVRIYEKVKFLNPETVKEQYCIRVRFDFSKKKISFKYKNSKKFMFGSLLCFTADKFNTIIFGKVAERKVEDLGKGELVVGFDYNVSVDYNVNYVMVECGFSFERYLNVLQNISVDNFPMEKYIIRVDPSAQPPEYLRCDTIYEIDGHQVCPLKNWPETNTFGLNDSQLAAFKAVLTQEFSLIQGPPGTGKTFLGLKIVKTLVGNRAVWYKKTPMLVVCRTNHALDQFLEGVSQFTEKILRIGGQSTSEKLREITLKNRKTMAMSESVCLRKNEVQKMLEQIRESTENLKQIEFYTSIRAFNVFGEVVPDFGRTWFAEASRDDILDWLFVRSKDSTVKNIDVNVDAREISEIIDSLDLNENEEDLKDSDKEEELDDDLENYLDDIFTEITVVQCGMPLITIHFLQKEIQRLQQMVDELVKKEAPTVNEILTKNQLKSELTVTLDRYKYLKVKLGEAKKRSVMKRERPITTDLITPQNMPPNDRWDLYFYWLDLYKQKLKENVDSLNNQFRLDYKTYEEMRDTENAKTMKDVLVVGMTTTVAARLRSSLQALKTPIVIVEEAAEVLEAHIVTALTPYCKHLILIGDHQQLKPSTASYDIERSYGLGISLFERMVINKIQLHTLNVQHRMRPEICNLITPTIYPNLGNHYSVNERPSIRGLDKPLFFIDHNREEADGKGTSKKNFHEVHFLINLAKHLILNGYKPENITILATYLEQMFEMQKEKKKLKDVLGDIRIAVLDNYQGEECDIILLSLVRSNKEHKIGFLSIENRVCVALSRARNGLYVMGNMTQLCSASKLWQKVCYVLEQQNAIGEKLVLRCQVHPDQITYVKSGDDFTKIPEGGGCNQKCGYDLSCGHKCTLLCHLKDVDHKDNCKQKCNKLLCDTDANHLCQKMCYEECGACDYMVTKILNCNHSSNLQCHVDPNTYQCLVEVSAKLPCGHTADKPCSSDPQTYKCLYLCEVKVEPCGHSCELTCHVQEDPDHLNYKCKKRCARYRAGCTTRKDNHMCSNACYKPCNRCMIVVQKKRSGCSHQEKVFCCQEPSGKCEIKVDKVNSCGHTIRVKCCDEPNRNLCKKKCSLQLPCGHPCTKKCNEPCTTNCEKMVTCSVAVPCGHTITEIKCELANSQSLQDPKTLLKYCNQPCTTKLTCKHTCSGTCGECYQGRIHKRCDEKCGLPLICSHICEFFCGQTCAPCSRQCPIKCEHKNYSCTQSCGDLCTPCRAKCSRGCRHQSCRKSCSEICSVPPCELPCRKTLKECGHRCIGFCGDTCPPKCLVCNKEELTTIFGSEAKENARFVQLDCGHILESTALEGWMEQDRNKIGFKECPQPQCKCPIKTTQRYNDAIKQTMADVAKIKQDYYGNRKKNDAKRRKLVEKFELIQARSPNKILNAYSRSWSKALEIIKKRLQIDQKDKRCQINKPELNAIEPKLQIIEYVINICPQESSETLHEGYIPQVDFLMTVLIRDEDHITYQETEDIQFELNRLSRIVDFSRIKNTPQFASHLLEKANPKSIVEQIENILFGLTKFCDSDEVIVKGLLRNLSEMLASGVDISELEDRDIVRTVGFRKGHWYKCPNGHLFATECGRSDQEVKCVECGSTIDEADHSLVGE